MKRLFLTSSVNYVISDIVTHIENIQGLRVAFIQTAAEGVDEDKQWLRKDRQALVDVGFEVFDYTFTDKTPEAIRDDLSRADVLFVSGGNTFWLLEKIQKSGAKQIIRDLVENGKIYIGSSAGSLVTGPDIKPAYRPGISDKATSLTDYRGLELVNFLTYCHWGSDYFKDLYLNFRLKNSYSLDHQIILLTDYQYVRVESDMYRIEEVKHP